MQSGRLLLATVLLALAAPAAAQSASVTLTWTSFGEDKVGTFSNAQPNGAPDGRFQVVVDAAGDTVTGFELRTASADGSPCCGHIWDTFPGGWWVLGVFRNGVQLNPTNTAIADPVGTTATYDVYGQSSGYFNDGQHYRIDVTLASGDRLAAQTSVGAQASTPVVPVAPSAPSTPSASPSPSPAAPAPTAPAAPAPSAPAAPAPSSPAAPASGVKAKLALDVATGRRVLRSGVCSTLAVRYAASVPRAASFSIERRVGGLWRVVATARTTPVCSKRAARIDYRATLRAGTKVIARSAVATVVWR